MTDPREPGPEAAPDEAAERALRLGDAATDARLAEREARDPAFARQVEAWHERLGPLYEEFAPVEPPAGLWPRIAARLAAANDNAVRFWKRWAYGSTGLLAASVAGLAVLAVNRPVVERIVEVPAPAEAVRVATLAGEDGMPALVVTYDPHTGSLFVAPTMQMRPGDAIPTLWLVMPEGGTRLVGAIDAEHAATHSLPQEIRPTAMQATAFAISLEPAGEPLAPQARGPVVAVGEVSRL